MLETIDAYDQVAADFSGTRHRLWSELAQATQGLLSGQHLLDLGCGNGRLLQGVTDPTISYIGVDGADNLLDIARQQWDKRPYTTFAHWSPLDGALPLADASVDRVAAIAFLHHIPSRQLRRTVLIEMYRVLKPGGELHITCWRLFNWKYADLLVKYTVKKLLGQIDFEFSDIAMPYTQTDRKRTVLRYYHAYRLRELQYDLAAVGFTAQTQHPSARNLYLTAKK